MLLVHSSLHDSAIIYSNRLKVFALKDHLRDSSLSNLSLLGVNFLKFVPRVLHRSIKKHMQRVWYGACADTVEAECGL